MTNFSVAFTTVFQINRFFTILFESKGIVTVSKLIFFSDEKFAKPAGPDSKGAEKYGVGGMRLPVNCTEKREYFS